MILAHRIRFSKFVGNHKALLSCIYGTGFSTHAKELCEHDRHRKM